MRPSAIASPCQIVVDNVTHSFSHRGTSQPVLSNFTLGVGFGEVVALLGPSGIGKSTLLKIVAGTLSPNSGCVRFFGVDGTPLTTRPSLSMVFQDPALLAWRSVSENVRLPLELGRRVKPDEDRVRRALELVRLETFGDRMPSQLSGGMQSRVAVARALVDEPAILLLDEPLGSLDEITAETLLIDISRLIRDGATTTLFVTHSVEHAVFLADEIVVFGSEQGAQPRTLRMNAPGSRNVEFFLGADFGRSVTTVRRMMRAPGEHR